MIDVVSGAAKDKVITKGREVCLLEALPKSDLEEVLQYFIEGRDLNKPLPLLLPVKFLTQIKSPPWLLNLTRRLTFPPRSYLKRLEGF